MARNALIKKDLPLDSVPSIAEDAALFAYLEETETDAANEILKLRVQIDALESRHRTLDRVVKICQAGRQAHQTESNT